jgi:Flp pilus assembly protein TadD
VKTFVEMGRVLINSMLEEAIVDCTKALGVNPTNVIALKSRSALYNQTGEFELAAKDRVKLDSFRNAHYLLGLIQKKEPKRDS